MSDDESPTADEIDAFFAEREDERPDKADMMEDDGR